MKRYGRLWDEFCSVPLAMKAIELGTANKRTKESVRRKLCYDDKSNPNLAGQLDLAKVRKYAEKIVSNLENGWRHGPLKRKTIAPAHGKRRDIDCPTLDDHIIHWMLILTIKRPLTRGMYRHSYGSIPGRGIDGARRTAERWVRHHSDCRYFVKLDIRKFYPSIDHELLKAKFRRVIKDDRILGVIDQVIESTPNGIPIGTYTSQWFANFFLQDLDHFVKQDLHKIRRGKRVPLVTRYLRYMDDMLLFGTGKRDMEKAVRSIIHFCREELGLEIKPTWEIRRVAASERKPDGRRMSVKGFSPVDIVGYRFYSKHTEVRGSIYLHTQRLAAKIAKTLRDKGTIMPMHAQALVSLAGWFQHADSVKYLRALNQTVNIKFARMVISYAAKNGIFGNAARVFCVQRGRDGGYSILYGYSKGRSRWRDSLYCDFVVSGLPVG